MRIKGSPNFRNVGISTHEDYEAQLGEHHFLYPLQCSLDSLFAAPQAVIDTTKQEMVLINFSCFALHFGYKVKAETNACDHHEPFGTALPLPRARGVRASDGI